MTGRKGVSAGESKKQQQQQQQQPRQQEGESGTEGANADSSNLEQIEDKDASIKEFLHPLLLQLFRSESDIAPTKTAFSTNASGSGKVSQELGNLSLNRKSERKMTLHASTSPSSRPTSSGSRRSLSPTNTNSRVRSTRPNLSKNKDNVSESNIQISGEDEEPPPPPPPPPPSGIKVLRGISPSQLSPEKVATIAQLLAERELSDEDTEVLRKTRLTKGVRVLLYLRYQFSDSTLPEFLDSLAESCLALRMFEEEEMILKMPIFQLPPDPEPEEGEEDGKED